MPRRIRAKLEGTSPAASSAQSQERGQPTVSEGGTKATKKKRGTPRGDGTKEQQGTIYSKGRSKIDPQLGSKRRRCATPTYPKKIKGSAGSTNSSEVEEETPKAVLETVLSGPHKPKSNDVYLNDDDPMSIGNQKRQKGADQSADHSKKTRSKTSPFIMRSKM